MENICDYIKCSGCGACSAVCPKECITLSPDKRNNWHVFPKIDSAKCIDCGLCTHVCPVNNEIALNVSSGTYAAYALDNNTCNSSASGGIAYTLGEKILNKGGKVYGVIVEFGNNFNIAHKRIDNIGNLKLTQGSKYVQSDISKDIYKKIKTDLLQGLNVLFVGTGCQVAGIRNYLNKDYPNFYAVDIICHGVPSLKILKDFLSTNFELNEIKQLKFRDKNDFNFSVNYANSDIPIEIPLYKNLYMMGFLKGLFYRDSCYNCKYAQKDRCGDLTLGDFWGLKDSISPPSRKSVGTSVILINTPKGNDLYTKIRPSLRYAIKPNEEAIKGNPQLQHPSKVHYASVLFKRLYPVIGFRIAATICLIREKIFYRVVLPIIQKFK